MVFVAPHALPPPDCSPLHPPTCSPTTTLCRWLSPACASLSCSSTTASCASSPNRCLTASRRSASSCSPSAAASLCPPATAESSWHCEGGEVGGEGLRSGIPFGSPFEEVNSVVLAGVFQHHYLS